MRMLNKQAFIYDFRKWILYISKVDRDMSESHSVDNIHHPGNALMKIQCWYLHESQRIYIWRWKSKSRPPRIWMKWWIKWSLEALTKQQNRIRLEKFRQSPQNMKELSKQQAYKWPTFQSNNVRWMGNTGSTSTTANVWNVSDNRQSSCCPVLMGGYVDFSYDFSFDHLVRSKCPMLFHSVEKSFGENLIRNFLWSRIK